MVDDGHARLGGDVLAAGVDQVLVLFTGGSQRTVANDPVLGVKDNLFGVVHVVGAQRGHSDAQVDNPLILEFHGQPVAHGLALKSRLVRHQYPPVQW